jgi:hypothetical protein
LSRVSTCFDFFRLYSVKLSGKIGEIRRRPNTQPNRVRGSCACGVLCAALLLARERKNDI